jgi:hypothetical protein
MKSAKPIGSAEISSQSSGNENTSELTRADDAFQQADNSHVEISAKSLETALRRVSQSSTREIDSLVGEFHELSNKLRSDFSRIQRDLAEHTELSKGVRQLATIISDRMKKLPGVPGIT